MTSNRTQHQEWPHRPWFLALFLCVAGLIYHFAIDGLSREPANMERGRIAFAIFVLIGATSLAFTLERLRWKWSVVFSLSWGIVLAGISYWAVSPGYGNFPLDFPFWSGLLAAAIAVPLFQTIRDQGRVSLPYSELHAHAWSDVVGWTVAWAFVGISFALAHLLSALFDLVGLDFLKKLLRKEWFIWMYIGATFGGALGVLKEHQKIIVSLQNLVMTVLSILAPVLCVGLTVFIFSLPFTGLQPLWDATRGTTPILLSCAAGALILANAIIRNVASEESQNNLLRYSAVGLSLNVLPLAIIAYISMQQRIDQYGFTPDRLWGTIAICVGLAYGAAYLGSLVIARKNWMPNVRKINTTMAIALCLVTVFLALPIVDFGSLSAKDQLARLEDGRTKPEDFDYVAFAYDFGSSGRDALKKLQESDNKQMANSAKVAIQTENRWLARDELKRLRSADQLESKLVIFPRAVELPESLTNAINKQSGCVSEYCLLIWNSGATTAKLVSATCDNRLFDGGYEKCPPRLTHLNKNGDEWRAYRNVNYSRVKYINSNNISEKARNEEKSTIRNAIQNGDIEIRPVIKHQIFIGDKPVGEAFDRDPAAPKP